jgi:hypothetical protein
MAGKKLVRRFVISAREGFGFSDEPERYRYLGWYSASEAAEIALRKLTGHWRKAHSLPLPTELPDYVRGFVTEAMARFGEAMAKGEPGGPESLYDALSAVVRCPACGFYVEFVVGRLTEGAMVGCLDPWISEDVPYFNQFEVMRERYGG